MIFIDANFIMDLFVNTEDNHEKALNVWNNIKNEELIICNSIILEVMNVLNIKIKVSKELLKEIYTKLNSDIFNIIDDTGLYDDTAERQMNYLPERLPFTDCLYLELMEQLGIKQIATFDKHFKNKGIEIISAKKRKEKDMGHGNTNEKINMKKE